MSKEHRFTIAMELTEGGDFTESECAEVSAYLHKMVKQARAEGNEKMAVALGCIGYSFMNAGNYSKE